MGLMKDYISLICITDDTTLGEVLFVYKLEGVYTEIKSGVSINSDGEEVQNNTLVIVPYKVKTSQGETYLKPKAWEALPRLQKETKYTFREGDVILINQTPENCSTLEQVKQKYDDCYTIQAIKDFNKVYKHYELICK